MVALWPMAMLKGEYCDLDDVAMVATKKGRR